MKNYSILKGMVNVYKLLFFALSPFVIALIPIIPYLYNEANAWSLWFMFISVPLCVSLAMKFWHPDFMNKIFT